MISLRHKLWFSFGALLAVLIAASAITVLALTHHSQILESVFRENYDSVIYCDRMNDALDQLNSRAQNFLSKGDATLFAGAPAIVKNFDDNLARQIGNAHMPTELAQTESLADSWNTFKSLYSRLPTDPHPDVLYRDDLLPRFDAMRQMGHEIAALNINNMSTIDGRVKRTLVDVRNILIVFVISGAILAAAVLWASGSAILSPLRALTRSARRVEEGDLDLRLDVRSHDEIGQLAEAFNAMAAKLREFRRIDHERLARTQQVTQLAIDTLPDPVFVIGPQRTIEISNLSACTHFAIDPGKSIESIGAKWLMPLYESVRSTGQAIESHHYKSAVQLFADGQERFLLPRAMPMMQDEELIGVIVILVDVTRLRQVDEAKSSVISTVSHELRTPLTGLRMSLSMLAMTKFGDVTPEQEKLIKASREDSDRLYRIIENLLNISRLESGRSQFHFKPMSPAEIVSLALDPLRPSIDEKKLRLAMSVASDLPSIRADAMSISSALTNLLTNAIKFTPPGGEVRVSADCDDQSVTFSVADTGPGIPPEHRSRIFEKFFRIPREAGPSGAGLGLAIAKEIVEAHAGRIDFTAPSVGGAEFRIRIPIANPPVTFSSPSAATGTASAPAGWNTPSPRPQPSAV